MRFIGEDQEKTNKKQDKCKKAIKECQSLQDENKILENKINNVRSEISKNKDILTGYEDLKKFIIDLSRVQNAQWVEQQSEMKRRRRDLLKRRWIDEHKRDTKDDHIIFREDEDLFSLDAYPKGASSVADQSEKAGGALPTGGAGGLLKQRKAANAI